MAIRIRFGGQITERAMRTNSMVVKPPGLGFDARLLERKKQVLVQALVATIAIEAFDEGVLDWLAGSNELQPDPTPMRRFIDDSTAEFGAIVRYDSRRMTPLHHGLIESSGHIATSGAATHGNRQAFARPIIHYV